MRIAFPPPQVRKGVANETAMANEAYAALRQPRREIVVAALVNTVGLDRRDFLRGMHRHHRHLRILAEGGRILGERKIPLHRLVFDSGWLWLNMKGVD